MLPFLHKQKPLLGVLMTFLENPCLSPHPFCSHPGPWERFPIRIMTRHSGTWDVREAGLSSVKSNSFGRWRGKAGAVGRLPHVDSQVHQSQKRKFSRPGGDSHQVPQLHSETTWLPVKNMLWSQRAVLWAAGWEPGHVPHLHVPLSSLQSGSGPGAGRVGLAQGLKEDALKEITGAQWLAHTQNGKKH